MKPTANRPHRLVVVDPDVAFARTASLWLRQSFPQHHVETVRQLNTQRLATPQLALVEATHLHCQLPAALTRLKRCWPRTCLVLYDESPAQASLPRILTADIAGWLVKPLTRDALVAAVAAVLQGCTVLLNRLHALNHSDLPPAPLPAREPMHHDLSQRQRQILNLLARGLIEKEIAHLLQLSPRTINHHIERIYRRWNVHNRAEALRRWFLSSDPAGA